MNKIIREKEKATTVIIGAGPAGLSAGYYLVKHGRKVLILESDSQVGGISKTVNYKGYRFDIGGHRFLTKNKSIFKFWLELVGKTNMIKVNRLSRIYYNNKFFSYPVKPVEAFQKLGVIESIKVAASYIKIKIKPLKNEDSFENFMINRFGTTLFNTFFKNYTKKVMGIETSQMSADWAGRRVKGLSLEKVLLAAKSKNTATQTLYHTFFYPKLGPGQMWEAAFRKVKNKGGEILLNQKVIKILTKNKKVCGLKILGKTKQIPIKNQLLCSMPISSVIKALDKKPPNKVVKAASQLRYRDFITVGLIINNKDIFPDNWLYIHHPDLKIGRLQNYKNWSKAMVKNSNSRSTLGLEYFCNDRDKLWQMADKELIKLGINEMVKIGFIKSSQVIDGTVVRVKKAYPIYDLDYKKNVKTVKDWLDQNLTNLVLVGRNAMHTYNSQDHSTLVGILAAKNIVNQETNDLWTADPDN